MEDDNFVYLLADAREDDLDPPLVVPLKRSLLRLDGRALRERPPALNAPGRRRLGARKDVERERLTGNVCLPDRRLG